MNCWEYLDCGRIKGGYRESDAGVCPAYPDFGRSCATLSGTLCGGRIEPSNAAKLLACISCEYYSSPHHTRSFISVDSSLLIKQQ